MGAIRDKTWKDLAAFIQDIDSLAGARPNQATYKLLANQALAIIADESDAFKSEWTNTPSGGLTYNGSIPIPPDCIAPIDLYYDGVQLIRKHVKWLDNEIGAFWRQSIGIPTYWAVEGQRIVIDAKPTVDVTGKFLLIGNATLPEFSDDPNAPNPLEQLPRAFQILPAYYVLSALPVDVNNRFDVARKQEYTALWEQGLAKLQDAFARRMYVSYDH